MDPAPPASATAGAENGERLAPTALEAGLELLRSRPSWLFPADACPADVMPEAGVPNKGVQPERCTLNLQKCVVDCEHGDIDACYNAALRVQELQRDDEAAEALFLRTCKLGGPSGCTNRAAGMSHYDGSESALHCAARTYEKTCALDDAWGCAMFGFALARGQGVDQDLRRALEVLPKGCRHGAGDPACQAAQSLMSRLQEQTDH